MTHPAKNISVSINCPAQKVYEFASNAQNLPQWAAGLSRSQLTKEGDAWITDSPMGKVKVKFAEKNSFGVMDHDVTLPSGEVNHNPFRVVKNGDGSEVIFTLYRLPRMSDEDFKKDCQAVEKDLKTLKTLLES